MAKVWVMKVYQDWFDNFLSGFIGIDEEGLSDDFRNFSDKKLDNLFKDIPRRRVFFDRLINEISNGDVIVIGTGQTTKFNVVALAYIENVYEYDANKCPRHTRKAKIRKFTSPMPFDKWGWTRRLEEIKSSRMEEFAEIVAMSLNKI